MSDERHLDFGWQFNQSIEWIVDELEAGNIEKVNKIEGAVVKMLVNRYNWQSKRKWINLLRIATFRDLID
jgi:hypothetical protein